VKKLAPIHADRFRKPRTKSKSQAVLLWDYLASPTEVTCTKISW